MGWVVHRLSAADITLLESGTPWGSVSNATMVLAYPKRYCRPRSMVLASWGYRCSAESEVCVSVDRPALGGMLNFDHVGAALMTVIFTVLVQDFDGVMQVCVCVCERAG